MSKVKASAESKFVTGSKQTKSPKPKSLTPNTSSKGNKKRLGVKGKVVPY